jgi:AraC-like DNA-binding protein
MSTYVGYNLVQARIRERIERHGSLRAAARVLKVSPPYLCRLLKGEKKEGSDSLLRKLGLKREIRFAKLDALK